MARPRRNSAPDRLTTHMTATQQIKHHMHTMARNISRGMRTTTTVQHRVLGPVQLPKDKKFFVKGSTAAMLHGGNVVPGDVDMVAGNMPKAHAVLSQMGYQGAMMGGAFHHAQHTSVDVLNSEDWGYNNTPTTKVAGVRVATVAETIKQFRLDNRPEKQQRNQRLIGEMIRANTADDSGYRGHGLSSAKKEMLRKMK